MSRLYSITLTTLIHNLAKLLCWQANHVNNGHLYHSASWRSDKILSPFLYTAESMLRSRSVVCSIRFSNACTIITASLLCNITLCENSSSQAEVNCCMWRNSIGPVLLDSSTVSIKSTICSSCLMMPKYEMTVFAAKRCSEGQCHRLAGVKAGDLSTEMDLTCIPC